MTGLAIALVGGAGVFLIWSEAILGNRGPLFGRGPRRREPLARRIDRWLTEAGLDGVSPGEFLGTIVAVATVGAAGAWLVFSGPVSIALGAALCAGFPVAGFRRRRTDARGRAQEAWPRLIEELRLRVGGLGRSIPHALFDAGRHAPPELRSAFDEAHREWLLTRDFELTTRLLRARLADPSADVVCETLLVAHELAGTDLDRRLGDLAEDRRQDVLDRQDAHARQAGARFARRFVLVVPLGMALVGLSIGEGRSAYDNPTGQALVSLGLLLTAACWFWSARILRLPPEPRVFD